MNKQTEVGMQSEFWNEAGGRMWVDNIERTHALLQPLGEALMSRAAPGEGEQVLDIGCGGGLNSMEIAVLVGETGYVCGVDVSEMIVDHARAQPNLPGHLQFTCVDAAVEDFGDARFDLLFSRFGVMFFEDPKAAFANLRKALQPEGRLAFLCWQAPQKNPWLSCPMQAAFSILEPPEAAADPRAPGPFAFAEDSWITEILTDAGFADVEVENLEMDMPMGSLDDAVDYSMRFGPAVEALNQADDDERQAVSQAIRAAFAPFTSGDVVIGPTATWLVTANRG